MRYCQLSLSRVLIVVCVAAVAWTCGAVCRAQPSKPEAIAPDPTITTPEPGVSMPQDAASKPLELPGVTVLQERADRLIVQLPNRLIVIAQEFKAAPVVSAQVWVKTGSIYEQEHVGAGLSHFLEHLLSGGSTATRTEEENNRILGEIGARSNAATGLDTVRYYIDTTSGHTMTAVELLSDWMQNARITQEEYARERDVIQREFEMGQGEPGRIFWKVTQSARYREHPARHPTIGYLNEFLAVSRDEIHAFYKRMYVPNNMVFVVVGDIDRRAVVERIAKLWSGAKPGDLPAVTLPVESSEGRGVIVASGVADIRRPRLRLAYPGTRIGGEGDYALDLLGVILGQGESSMLARSVRDRQGLVSSISAYNLSFPWGEGFFGIDAEVVVPPVTPGKTARGVADEAIETTKQAILAEVARVRSEGITPDKLARAKREALARSVYDGQDANGIANRLASDTIGMGNPDYRARYIREIDKLTIGDVMAAAGKFLDDKNLMVLTLHPLAAGEKPEAMVRPPDAPPQPGVEAAPREAVELDNRLLAARVRDALSVAGNDTADAVTIGPIRRFVLPNGLRLLVQQSTIAPAVSIQLYQTGGLLGDDVGREGLSGAVAAMLLRGTATRTAEQISSLTDSLGVQVGSECGNNTSFVRALCLREDWKTTLELLADVSIRPSFPEDEWKKMQPRLLAAIAREQDSWSGELRARFREAYFASHPWSQSTLGRASVVEKLTAEDLKNFHRLRLGASNAVLVVFGDVDVEQVHAEAARLFEDMPREALSPAMIPEPAPPVARVVQSQTKKPLAAVTIGFGPGATRRNPDYAALRVLTRVLSSFPSGWLEGELRGRGPGLVYAVGAGHATGLVPGYFAVTFNAQPGQVTEAISRTMGVIKRARTQEVDDATLARAKAGVLTDEFTSQQSNEDRAADAALDEIYGLPEDEAKQFIAEVGRLTPDTLRTIAELYLRNPVVVVLSHQPLDAESLKAASEGRVPAPESSR